MRHFLLCGLMALAPSVSAQTTYRVSFESAWSAAAYPAGFPSNAHFSPLVGTSHSDAAAFWTPGMTASAGIEAMAERGQTALLVQEIDAAMGAARPGLVGPGVPVSPGSAAVEITVTDAHPLVTLVSMLAPSPDWFVGVHGLDLRVGGEWPATATVPLAVYDAGTDSGTAYTSPDADTQPRAPISLLAIAPFTAGAAVGTFTFTRLTTSASDGEAGPAEFSLESSAPNPARSEATLTLLVGRPQSIRIRMLDALGRTVAVHADGLFAAGVSSVRMDVGRLAAGVYTVVAEGETTRALRRVSVVR